MSLHHLPNLLSRYSDIISKELNNVLRKITNNTFRTKKIKIPEDKKLKTYEHVKYVYELIGKNNYVLD
jgi:hypothetical protein